jgi:rifampin ADP-ribosylating transferase
MMEIDTANPVVQLCVAGVDAEQAGDGERAAALYRRAWEARTDALDAAMAAHYLARVQSGAAARLRWNQLALEQALAAGERAASFLPSLYLNLGHSREESGDFVRAASAYEQAQAALTTLESGLADSLRIPIERAQRRVTVADGRT